MDNKNAQQQIEYLKSKIVKLEYEKYIQRIGMLLLLCAFVGFSIGIIFMILGHFIIGMLSILLTFSLIMVKFYKMYQKLFDEFNKDDETKLDHLLKILNIK